MCDANVEKRGAELIEGNAFLFITNGVFLNIGFH